jgi:hypothetical protein
MFRNNDNQLIEVRSDVEGALLGWLPPPLVRAGDRFPRLVRFVIDPYWLAVFQGRPIVPPPWSPVKVLELPVAEWASYPHGAYSRYVIPETRLAYVCRLDNYDELRAVRAFLPCDSRES